MKKLIQKIREKKGFTLAELLIVVAIIAVLVAIAIPIFTTQLEKSRDSVTVSNLRAAYAEAMVDMLDKGTTTSTQKVTCKGIMSDSNLSGTASELPFSGNAVATIAAYTTAQDVNVVFTLDTSTDAVSASVAP